ncbi:MULTISPECIES: hypothetical protein [unclassified Streptomyces]|uniref:hypothetical protein n=1 Tax=unclassified Streptomyces TaxID=2593676 RepID=UPI003649ECC7
MRVRPKTTRRMAVVATAAAALATAGLATAPIASADDYNGCGWPRVCFYLTDSDWNDGVTYYACLKPNQTFHFSSTSTVTGVRIDTQSSCPSV